MNKLVILLYTIGFFLDFSCYIDASVISFINMKVVVLDDEKRVCTLVCTLILWNELGLELAGTAFDGEQGLELIKKVNPDIVITDIRMPSLDGLQVIEKAKEFNSDLQCIIVSGYSQFDYAKKAIKYGVSDYLLKPLNQEELNSALRKLIKVSNEQKKAKGNLIDSESIRHYYLNNFITAQKNIHEVSSYFTFSDRLAVSLINCDGEFYKYDEQAIKVIRNKMRDVFLCYTSFTEDWDLWYVKDFHCFVLIVSFSVANEDKYMQNLKYAFHEIVLNFSNLYQDLIVTFSLGTPITATSQLSEQIKKVTNTSIARLYTGRGDFNEQTQLSFIVDTQTRKSVSSQIKNLSIREELDTFEIQKQMTRLSKLDYSTFPLTIEAVTKDLQLFYFEKIANDAEKINFNKMYYAKDIKQVVSIVQKQIELGFSLIREKFKNETVKPIKEAKKYIESHYANEQISLEFLSEKVQLSPTYFSSLFKKETDIGFSEYVRNVRIEKSKELLASTSFAVKDIANKVGYTNSRQFAKCFIKQVGIKPQDYRKLYG